MTKPELEAVCPGETTEVVTGESVMTFSLTRVAPLELVPQLRWQTGRSPERGIRHLADDGTIERAVSLHGIYRPTKNSEAALLALA